MRQCGLSLRRSFGRERPTGQREVRKASASGEKCGSPVVSFSSFEFYLLAGVNIQLRRTKLRSVPAALRSTPVGAAKRDGRSV